MPPLASPLSRDEQNLLENWGDLVYLIDEQHRLLFVNQELATQFRFESAAALGKRCFEVIGCSAQCCPHCPLDRIIHSPRQEHRHFISLPAGEGSAAFEFDARPYIKKGKVKGYLINLKKAPVLADRRSSPEEQELARSVAHQADIRDVFDLKMLEEMVSIFADLHGVTSAVFDHRQEMVTGVYNFSEACQMVRSTKQGLDQCLESDRRLLEAADSSGPCVLPCRFAGLMDAVSPIVIEGKRFGTWALGQVRLEGEADQEHFRAYAEQLGLDPDRYLQALQQQTTMPREKMQKLSEFLALLTRMLGKIGLQNLVLDYLHERNGREKELLSITLRSTDNGIVSIDREGGILLINEAAEKMTGWPATQAVGRPLVEVLQVRSPRTGEEPGNFMELLRSSGEDGQAQRLLLRDREGAERFIICRAMPLTGSDGTSTGLVVSFQDVTEKMRIEEELAKIEKLESIGVLAGGIAHDFNNLLTAILGNLSLARFQTDPGDRRFELLETAQKASLRARDLTQQLLTFAKGGAPIKRMASINDLIRDTADFALRGSKVGGRYELPADLWPVSIDEAQISQVFNNLIINAQQAMERGGRVIIRGENIRIGVKEGLPLAPGPYLRLTVEDEGEGIPAPLQAKIFDPFYTTKPRGSGLGLAICHSILKNHHGQITVDSQPGKGARFHLFLPASPAARPEKPVLADRIAMGSGRILVMDDDPAVLHFVRKALELLGYTAEVAKDGDEALLLFRQALALKAPFKGVLLDLTVPGGKGGVETIGGLRELDCGIKAIVMSGYSRNPVMSSYAEHGFQDVLAKPFRITELSAVLHRTLLDGQDSTRAGKKAAGQDKARRAAS